MKHTTYSHTKQVKNTIITYRAVLEECNHIHSDKRFLYVRYTCSFHWEYAPIRVLISQI